MGNIALVSKSKVPTDEQIFVSRACGINGPSSYHAEHQMHRKLSRNGKSIRGESFSLRYNYRRVHVIIMANRGISLQEAQKAEPSVDELAAGWGNSMYCTHCALESMRFFTKGNYIKDGMICRESFDTILDKSDYSFGIKRPT